MREVRLRLPLNRDILRWVVERALEEYIRLERVLYEQQTENQEEGEET